MIFGISPIERQETKHLDPHGKPILVDALTGIIIPKRRDHHSWNWQSLARSPKKSFTIATLVESWSFFVKSPFLRLKSSISPFLQLNHHFKLWWLAYPRCIASWLVSSPVTIPRSIQLKSQTQRWGFPKIGVPLVLKLTIFFGIPPWLWKPPDL